MLWTIMQPLPAEQGCQTCPYGDLNPLETPAQNWESISMDFITDLPPSHGFDTLLVVVDCLSKQSHFIPMIRSLDAPGLAQLYISSIFKLHGLPSSIISDQDPLFTSLFLGFSDVTTWNPTQTFHSLSSTDRWSNRASEPVCG